MDNRMNTLEDSQSTPEHLAGQVGGPGFAKESDSELGATPGGLRKSMLDSDHDAHTSGGFDERQSQMQSSGSQRARGDGAVSETWRTRLTQRAQSMRTTATAHPLAVALIALGVVLGIASFMRSRSSER